MDQEGSNMKELSSSIGDFTATRVQTEALLRRLVASRKSQGPLERPFYTDPAIFDIDLERVFMKRWLFVGHTSRVPRPGDYFTYEIGNESLIIVRGKDQEIRALFNVCRHRGSRICLEPAGHVNNSLVCPYHQWVYKTDGTLTAARLMPKNFDKSQYGLYRAHTRVLEGLIFISLAKNPPDFHQIEDEVKPGLTPYDLSKAKICATKHFNVHANWKLIAENLRECYHCAANHPEYCNTVVGASTLENPRAAAEFEAYLKECKEKWKTMGLPDVDSPLRSETVQARYPLRKGYQSESLDGRPLAPLMGNFTERDGGIYGLVVIPNLYLEATCDCAYTVRMTPISVMTTNFELNWYVRNDATEGVDYDVDQIVKVANATWSQDFRLCENNQLGVNSSRYQPGPYAPAELYSFEYGAIQEVGVCEQVINWYLSDLRNGM
jgi:Rieske 2Fe-2S family protein